LISLRTFSFTGLMPGRALEPHTDAAAASGGSWARRTADTVMKSHPLLMERWHYEFGLMLKAIAAVWRASDDPRYFDFIRRNMEHFVDEQGQIRTYRVGEYNLDQVNSGKILLLLDQATGDPRYRKAAAQLREQLAGHPRTAAGGFWHKKIYPHQMWLDGIYMEAPFYAEYAKVFAEPAGFDDVANQIILIAEHTRDPRTGLFYHGWDESKTQAWADPETGCSPHFWGRAVGWYAMALVDVLDYFPADHPARPRLLQILQGLAEAVAKVQDPESGLWYQVLDQGPRAGNYLEASGSAMFVYVLAKGVRQGYLDEGYRSVAGRGFQGMIDRLVAVDSAGGVHLNQICQVAGLGRYEPTQPYRDGSYAYYVGEPKVADDFKGVGPFILACVAMERDR
jgi:unsaturated rhamnogalacturonyl hydrolase